MAFELNFKTSDGNITLIAYGALEACFDVLRRRGCELSKLQVYSSSQDLTLAASESSQQYNLAYRSYEEGDVRANLKEFYWIKQTSFDEEVGESNLTFEEFEKKRLAWSRWNIARKIFHPGNSLTIAVILTAIGIGLIGFGVACPPALVFVALGVAAFSAVSAIIYAIDWLARDWIVYKAEAVSENEEASLKGYLENCWERFKEWVPNHKPQAIMMGIGAALFLGALIVTTGGLAAPAVFGFMAMGASGGAIGLVSSFFGAGLSGVSALVFAGAALIVGPTNIVDTIRRFASGIWKHIGEEENSLPDEPALRVTKDDVFSQKVERNNAGDVEPFEKPEELDERVVGVELSDLPTGSKHYRLDRGYRSD